MSICAAVVSASLVVGGCGDLEREAADEQPRTSGVTGAQADAVVDNAVQEVIGEGPFRSRISGGIPFSVEVGGVYEQSDGDQFAVEIYGDGYTAAATAVVADTAYEWDSQALSWMETPRDSFDPLLAPGAVFYLALAGIWDVTDDGGVAAGSSTAGAMPDVATGWAETTSSADGRRRFERTLGPEFLLGSMGESAGAPRERREERAVLEALAREAQITSIVEIDADGNLSRYVVRIALDEDHSHPDCGPLNKVVGASEMIIEFSDVGAEFSIEVPDPDELVERYPALGEAPDFSENVLDPSADAFTNDAGERDLTGCPTPDEQPSTNTADPSTTSVESCQVEGLTIRTAVLAFQADTGQLPASLDDLTEWLVDAPSDEWTYEVSGDDFQLDGPCDLP